MIGLYELATGRLVSVGTAPEVVPDGHAVASLPEGATYGVTHLWNESTRAWRLMPTPEVTRMTAGDFMRRLGFEREAYLHALRLNASAPLETRAQVETLLQWLNRIVVTGVDLDDPIVPLGVEIMTQVLTAGGRLPEGPDAFRATMLRRTP